MLRPQQDAALCSPDPCARPVAAGAQRPSPSAAQARAFLLLLLLSLQGLSLGSGPGTLSFGCCSPSVGWAQRPRLFSCSSAQPPEHLQPLRRLLWAAAPRRPQWRAHGPRHVRGHPPPAAGQQHRHVRTLTDGKLPRDSPLLVPVPTVPTQLQGAHQGLSTEMGSLLGGGGLVWALEAAVPPEKPPLTLDVCGCVLGGPLLSLCPFVQVAFESHPHLRASALPASLCTVPAGKP